MMSMGGFLGLLDLNKDAKIGLDGQTIVLRTDDFVGVSGIDHGLFHLATVRAQPNASICVGFIMASDDAISLVRKYDPLTEEVSSRPVDILTTQNIMEQVRHGQMPPTSVVDYSKIVSSDQRKQWIDQTKFILSSGILKVRGLETGDKVIPGSYQDDDDEPNSKVALSKSIVNPDGKSVMYPSIPVVDTTISLQRNRHRGTKRHLLGLSPSQRTKLFTEPSIATLLLRDVLALHYKGSWEMLLGDLQLAYVLFLYLQCLASLEHWKDLVAMLALVEPSGMKMYPQMYEALIQVLPSQLFSVDQGFLEDVDDAGNNFLIPSLKTLCRNLSRAAVVEEQPMLQFQRLLSNKFPSMIVVDDDEEGGNEDEVPTEGKDDDSGDSDGPVVVDIMDIEASLARTSHDTSLKHDLPSSVIAGYPLLVAAILPHEDILMTCARVMDEKKDVSVVREAAAYLEEIEQNKF